MYREAIKWIASHEKIEDLTGEAVRLVMDIFNVPLLQVMEDVQRVQDGRPF